LDTSLSDISFLAKCPFLLNHINLPEEKLIATLNDCDWNKAEVGRRLGLSRTAIWKYMKKWDIPLKQPLPT